MAASRLEPVGISAWSSLSALGALHFPHDRPRPTPEVWRRDAGTLSPHPEWLGLPGRCGRVSIELSPLPAPLLFRRSRATELLVHALSPLRIQLQRICQRYGSHRVGIVLGSSTGGIDATEHAVRTEALTGQMPSDFLFEEAHVFSALVRVVQALCDARGPAYVVSTACSSSGKALGAAQRLILSGACDAVLTGGVDSLSELTLRGFGGLSILSPTMCKPFDANRDGISLGEGASLLLLERDATSEFLLTGVGEASDAYHPTAPHPDGVGAERALRACLEHSGFEPAQIDYVNAHGTGTIQNDRVEALVIDRALGHDVPFSSTKDRTGHQLGTAGATEAIISLMALASGELPPNRVPDTLDTTLPRQPFLGAARRSLTRPPTTILSNSFAFGGSNVTVGLEKSVPFSPASRPEQRLVVLEAVTWGLDGDAQLACEVLPARARGRSSSLTRIFSELFGRVVEARRSIELPMFFGSAYGEMSTTISLLDQMLLEPTVSPAKFQASVHNTAAGLLSMATDNRAPATAIAAGEDTVAMTLADASAWLSCHGGRALVLVADERGPERLLRGRTFPALGIGLLLSARPDPERPALGSIARPTPVPAAKRSHEPRANPASWGLELVSFLTDRSAAAAATIQVGPDWAVQVERSVHEGARTP